ncbi:MAG: class I SAM-dependent methyltransferase [Kiritimatiellae bacterium]|nr:class I SAM-dependent methyltransferase [Kiritimatiellia bacterium]
MIFNMTSSSRSLFDFSPLAARYDAWYRTAAGRRHDAAQKKAVLELLPAARTGKKKFLLDAGCGTGHWSVFFAKHGFEATGVDVSPEMISAARARRAPHCRFAVADVMLLPFPDGDFDAVSAMAALEFVPDARRVCAEMFRCLKSGGRLIVGTLNRLAGLNRRRIADRSEPYLSARMFSPKELRKLLSQFGRVNIRLTAERGAGDESGAFIVAAAVKS